MRRLERWLHQHIFKVGWLLTKNLHTTTILYYTFFLPGVVAHEIVRWLVAGVLNVRAERAIAMPEAQAIAELKLNFIRLTRNTNRVKDAIIGIAPLVTGLALIWLISNNVLNLNLIVAVLRAGGVDGLGSALRLVLATPDVWLWVYFMFTIANTMIPHSDTLRAWRPALIAIGAAVGIFFVLGLAQQVFLENLAIPITEGLNRLALIFAVVIAINALATGVLGIVEAIIERITGDSATFQNGKLIAVRREEILQQRAQERAKQQARQSSARGREAARTRIPAGPPSVYALPLPIPGAPGKEASEPIIVSRESRTTLSPGTPPAASTPRRVEPSVIAGTAVIKTDEEVAKQENPRSPLQEAKIDLSAFEVGSQSDEDDEVDENTGHEVDPDIVSEEDEEERL